MRPISGIRYHCTTCPAGQDNDLCEKCYRSYQNGKIEHPSMNTLIENKNSHIFVTSEGKSPEQYNQWLEVSHPNVISPSIAYGFLVRLE